MSIRLTDLNKEFLILDKLTGCDLCKGEIKVPECKTFVHLASLTNVRKSFSKSRNFIIQNCLSTLKCLDYARSCNAHFIFTSSMGALASLSPYAASKLACEACCTAYRESFNMNITVLRLSNVYGPHSLHKTSVIAKFIKNCLNKEPLTVYGDGLQTRDFIHVSDVIDLIINCPDNKLLKVGSGTSTSILRLTKMVKDISNRLTSFIPEIHFQRAIKGEIDKASKSTDIESKVNLEEGLEKTFNWYMEHYENKRLE